MERAKTENKCDGLRRHRGRTCRRDCRATAAELGAHTELIARAEFGGMAANDGPVPVRTLAHASRLMRDARQLGRYGIAVSEPTLDYARLLTRVREVVEDVRSHSCLRQQLDSLGVTVREHAGAARFIDAHTIETKGGLRLLASNEDGVRVFVVHSEERLAFERSQRTKSMERVRIKLAALEKRVAEGRLKSVEKIGAAAAAILTRNHRHRYFDWCLENGGFRFFEHPVHFTREQAYEGKYVQTEEKNLSPTEAVRLYKELSEVERAISNIKDVIEMRPIYHRDPDRVSAHVFVAVLAFVLYRAIEKKLKAAKLDLSAAEALTALKSVRVVDIDLGNGTRKRCVTRGSQRTAPVLSALGITELDPPTPPRPGETRT